MSEPYIYTDDPNYAECRHCKRMDVLNALDGLCHVCHRGGTSEWNMRPDWNEAMEQADVDFHAEGGTE